MNQELPPFRQYILITLLLKLIIIITILLKMKYEVQVGPALVFGSKR